MFDKVTITYRGAKYEIGRGRDFYGIWMTGAPRSQPLEWWPETAEGWSAAWTRFASIEAPGAIVPVGRRTPPVGVSPVDASPVDVSPVDVSSVDVSTVPTGENPGPFGHDTAPLGETGETTVAAGGGAAPYGPGPGPRVGPAVSGRTGAIAAAAALGVGVILGVAGLFPAYLGGSSLAQQADQLIPHAIYLAVWTASAALILLGGARLRLGALLGLGLSVVTFGLFFADAGTAIAGGGNAGAGLVLSLVGWLACAAGSVAAFLLQPAGSSVPAGQPRYQGWLARPRGAELGLVVMVVLAGLGVAAAFAPAWDSFTLHTAAGQTQSLTLGNAFSNPGLVIAGDVAVMVALAAVVIVAALWRPVRHGGVLLAGAVIPMAAQAISALVQAAGPPRRLSSGSRPRRPRRSGSRSVPDHAGVLDLLRVPRCAGRLVSWMLFTPYPAAGPRPSAGADAYAWAGPHDDLTDEEADDDTDTDTGDVVTPDFETAPSHTEGGARFGASPAA